MVLPRHVGTDNVAAGNSIVVLNICAYSRHLFWILFVVIGLFLSSCDGPVDRERSHLERGLHLLEASHLEDARAELRNARLINPSNTGALFHIARSFEQERRWVEAHDAYAAVIGEDPKHVAALTALARLSLFAGELSTALSRIDRAITLHRRSVDAWAIRAAILVRQDRVSEAGNAARHAMSLETDDRVASALLAQIDQTSGGANTGAVRPWYSDLVINGWPRKYAISKDGWFDTVDDDDDVSFVSTGGALHTKQIDLLEWSFGWFDRDQLAYYLGGQVIELDAADDKERLAPIYVVTNPDRDADDVIDLAGVSNGTKVSAEPSLADRLSSLTSRPAAVLFLIAVAGLIIIGRRRLTMPERYRLIAPSRSRDT